MENEIKRLIEVNNNHLRNKGKLLQEILDLKKQIVQQDKNLEQIATLQSQNAALSARIDELLQQIAESSNEVAELKKQLSLAQAEKLQAIGEVERLINRNWFQRLFANK